MKRTCIIDTGPLVAFLNRRETHHDWVKREFACLVPPLLTCEAVIAEACWLLRGSTQGVESIMELLSREIVKISFNIQQETEAIRNAMKRYSNLPMSLADACLVRMAEINVHPEVMTLDAHFHVYRMANRWVIPVLMPK